MNDISEKFIKVNTMDTNEWVGPPLGTAPPGITHEILRALRKIMRAIDLQSRQLVNAVGLTGPQLVLIQELAWNPTLGIGGLARQLNLSPATVTDIVIRLEGRGLVRRLRDEQDRRKVMVEITADGHASLKKAPPLLQERFTASLLRLQKWEQTQLLTALERIAFMMSAENIDAASLLETAAVNPAEVDAVRGLLATPEEPFAGLSAPLQREEPQEKNC